MEDKKSQVLTKGTTSFDGHGVSQRFHIVRMAVPGENDFGLELVNHLARSTTKVIPRVHYGIIVFFAGLSTQSQNISKEKM